MAEALPSTQTNPPIKQFAHKYTYLGIDAIASRDLGAGARAPSIGSGQKGPDATPTLSAGGANTPSPTGPQNGHISQKRAASPPRRREPSPPPAKRFKGNSPPPLGSRGRDWESRERDRGKRDFTPPRKDYRRNVDSVPEGVVWFMTTLPSAASFDGKFNGFGEVDDEPSETEITYRRNIGPRFRTDDVMQLFKTASLPAPHVGPTEPRRSRSPPPRGTLD